jgi:hypothetical protein
MLWKIILGCLRHRCSIRPNGIKISIGRAWMAIAHAEKHKEEEGLLAA